MARIWTFAGLQWRRHGRNQGRNKSIAIPIKAKQHLEHRGTGSRQVILRGFLIF